MKKLLTTVVQNTSEPKIDMKNAGQPKKTDTADAFGDCLRSLESMQSTPDKNEEVEEKKEKNSVSLNVPSVGVAIIAYIPEDVISGASAAASETSESELSLPALSAGIKREIIDSGIMNQGTVNQGTVSQGTVSQGTVSQGTVSQGAVNQGAVNQETINHADFDTTKKEVMENLAKTATDNQGKTVTQKPETTSELKSDLPLSTDNRIKTMSSNETIPSEIAGNSAPLNNPNDSTNKIVKPEQNTVAAAEIKTKTAEEVTPKQITQDKSMKSDAEYQISSSTKLNGNSERSEADRSTQPISGEESKSNKTSQLSSDKTLQSKSGETNTSENDNSFSLTQKETGKKKVSGPEKAETQEFSLAGINIGKENENSAAINGENVVSQITRAIKEKRVQDNTKITVELAPKELGKISVEMKLSDGKLNLLMNAENKETADALSEHIGLLKTALAANKVEIQNLDVGRTTIDMSFSNTNGSGGKFSGEDRGVYYKNDASNFSGFEDKSESTKQRTYSQPSQLLNYLA